MLYSIQIAKLYCLLLLYVLNLIKQTKIIKWKKKRKNSRQFKHLFNQKKKYLNKIKHKNIYNNYIYKKRRLNNLYVHIKINNLFFFFLNFFSLFLKNNNYEDYNNNKIIVLKNFFFINIQNSWN